jgi:hypothetical protein
LFVIAICPHPVTVGVPRFTPVAKHAPAFVGTLLRFGGQTSVSGVFGTIVTVVVVELEQYLLENT